MERVGSFQDPKDGILWPVESGNPSFLEMVMAELQITPSISILHFFHGIKLVANTKPQNEVYIPQSPL